MNRKTSKTAQIIQTTLAQTLSKFRKNNNIYTITNIQISPDLKNADIWISNINSDSWNIDNMRQFIPEFIIALKKTELRNIPKLRFQKDLSGSHTEKIDDIFKQIHES